MLSVKRLLSRRATPARLGWLIIYSRMCALVGASSPLQGDEHHDFAFTHRIKTFQEKVIVYRPCRRVPCRVLTARKFRNKHRHIDKRNIGDSKIKVVHERLFNLLEALYPYFLSGMQVLQYLASHQVFLKSHNVRVRPVLQHLVGADVVFMQHVCDCPGYLRRVYKAISTDCFMASMYRLYSVSSFMFSRSNSFSSMVGANSSRSDFAQRTAPVSSLAR